MVVNAENILQKLNLPYRVVALSTGDMGSQRPRLMTWKYGFQRKTPTVKSQAVPIQKISKLAVRKIRYRDEADGKVKLLHT